MYEATDRINKNNFLAAGGKEDGMGSGYTWTKNDTIFWTLEAQALGWDLPAYFFSGCHPLWELNYEIFGYMRYISTFTIIMVTLSSLFFLPSLRGVLILALSVLMIFTHLTASLVWLGYKLNILTAVNIVMAIGLAVDYSAHIIHAYYSDENAVEHEEDTPFTPFTFNSENEAVRLRMERALFAMGPPVISGAGTTFLGVMMLGFSGSPVFRMFFWLIFVLVIAAASHALIFVPVLLSFFPPSPAHRGRVNTELHATRHHSKAAEERRELKRANTQ